MKSDDSINLKNHPVVSREEWLSARTTFLAKEKEFTRLRDELSQQRRDLPWVKVDKEYIFDGPNGKETLANLFDKRSQLVIYHFMFCPEWDEGCPHCSHWADNFNGIIVHLNQRDVTMVRYPSGCSDMMNMVDDIFIATNILPHSGCDIGTAAT